VSDQGFVSAPLDGAFYQSAAFFPMPVMLVLSHGDDGELNLAPYSQCFPQPSAGDQVLMLVCKADSKTARNVEATGKASLCFLTEEPHLMANCVALSKPATSAERRTRSIFTLDEIDSVPVVEEAEQVFACSLLGTEPGLNDREVRLLLQVDTILLKPRWLRALKRGWGAPRLAVEFGFRGSSARWLSRPSVHFEGPSLRPKFEVTAAMSAKAAAESMQRALDAPDTGVEGFARDASAQVNVPADEAHFWSPQLDIKLDEVDGKARIRGRIGPHPQVWMLFIGLHLAIALSGIGGAIFGFSQWLIDAPPVGLWAIPAALVLHAFAAGAAFVGQGLGAEHVFRLRAFVDDALMR